MLGLFAKELGLGDVAVELLQKAYYAAGSEDDRADAAFNIADADPFNEGIAPCMAAECLRIRTKLYGENTYEVAEACLLLAIISYFCSEDDAVLMAYEYMDRAYRIMEGLKLPVKRQIAALTSFFSKQSIMSDYDDFGDIQRSERLLDRVVKLAEEESSISANLAEALLLKAEICYDMDSAHRACDMYGLVCGEVSGEVLSCRKFIADRYWDHIVDSFFCPFASSFVNSLDALGEKYDSGAIGDEEYECEEKKLISEARESRDSEDWIRNAFFAADDESRQKWFQSENLYLETFYALNGNVGRERINEIVTKLTKYFPDSMNASQRAEFNELWNARLNIN